MILSDLAHTEGEVKTMTDLARNPKQIGNLVPRARKKHGLSQRRLARRPACGRRPFPGSRRAFRQRSWRRFSQFWPPLILNSRAYRDRKETLPLSRISSDAPPPPNAAERDRDGEIEGCHGFRRNGLCFCNFPRSPHKKSPFIRKTHYDSGSPFVPSSDTRLSRNVFSPSPSC